MSKKFNPRLQAAYLEVVENQLVNNDPPETRQTYERLVREGHSEKDAKKLIGAAIAAETYWILKENQPFNQARFVAALNKLPKLPE
ncbi:MAG: hypothetical protein HGB21_15340 [Nitrospirae bacterium]|nr:hypothetical protein [Nitrospirota bacterium]NTW67657.1 hypothetical protein [Nitrospirota bacterium]